MAELESPAQVLARLAEVGYLTDDALATAVFLAVRMRRPLFCEGEAGVGKTSLGAALAQVLGARLLRLQCYEGLDASQALYEWDFPRQLLHLRAAEASGVRDAATLEAGLYDRRFLLARPLLAALEGAPCVLLVDEIDRADDEFEAFLLEVLGEFSVTVPELGTIRAEVPPVVVLTSNRTREVHDALKRRCLYAWLDHPDTAREAEIIRLRHPAASRLLSEQVALAASRLRAHDLLKPPGIAETLDWAEALLALGAVELDTQSAARTLTAVLKYREDQQRVLRAGLGTLVASG